jgi:hypothetical protein
MWYCIVIRTKETMMTKIGKEDPVPIYEPAPVEEPIYVPETAPAPTPEPVLEPA